VALAVFRDTGGEGVGIYVGCENVFRMSERLCAASDPCVALAVFRDTDG